MKWNYSIVASLIVILLFGFNASSYALTKPKTVVSIEGQKFLVNGVLTYKGRSWNGISIEGLLLNSRMVQGIFDDENGETAKQWAYPDTKVWSADRNTNEFIKAMPIWKSYGLIAFTLNLQGGSPTGYGNKGWRNSAFDEAGNMKPAYFNRLEKILNRADELGMVCILGYFYFGQDQFLRDSVAVINATTKATEWILSKGYRNVIIELNNECNLEYDHNILKNDRVHELINLVKSKKGNGYSLLVSTSYGGNFIPQSNVVKCADYILIHGNGVSKPSRITEMVEQTRAVEGYRPMPIVFNEDDHFKFDEPSNNFVEAIKASASWGYFDYRMKGETAFDDGYQSIPVNWGVSSPRKKAFFEKLKEITGGF